MDNPFRGISTIHILCRFESMVEHLPGFIQRRFVRQPVLGVLFRFFPATRFAQRLKVAGLFRNRWPESSEMNGWFTPKWVAVLVRNTQ
jgi:hypothetical protein